MAWSESQQHAINDSGNLIVSAGAGAGKTTVLTERICSRIVAGTPVERILVLTFTRSAAAEMKHRIQTRLQKAVEECDDSRRAFLLAQASAVNSANISTIDAFCIRILHRHGHTIGLDSNIRIADKVQLAVLSQQIRDAFFTDLVVSDDPDYKLLLPAFRREDTVWSEILFVDDFLSSRPDPDKWLSEVESNYLNESYVNGLLTCLTEDMRMTLSDCISRLAEERDQLMCDQDKALAVLDEDLMRCRAILAMDGFDRFREAVLSGEFARMNFARGTDDSVKKPVQAAREALKNCIKSMRAQLPRTESEEASFMQTSLPYIHALISLVRRYRDMLGILKQKRGLIDFSDAEHLALQLLSDPAISEEYRNKFEYIAIDEYQDSNGVQEALINRIRRENNLFLVGDVKQSIYRFRSAEPSLFLEKLRTYTGAAGNRINLNQNFRCSAEVIDAVNKVFSLIMREPVGEMNYDDQAKLIQAGSVTNGKAELYLISESAPEDPADADEDQDKEDLLLEEMSTSELEAMLIAKKIRDILQTESYTDGNGTRPLKFSDFAILMRETSSAQTFAEVLAREGIPCFAQASGGYFDAIEVIILLNYLRIIDNRKQDIPLLSVLRSCLFHFTAEDFAKIKLLSPETRKSMFHESFFAVAEMDETDSADPDTVRKVHAAAEKIDRMHSLSQILSVSELLLRMIDETGYYEQTGALPSGAQRQRNIDALLERARNFETSGQRGIWKFVRTMDAASDQSALGIPQEAGGDVVRIMTIHKSKGLEFPVVFVARLDHGFNRQDLTRNVLIHSSLGIGIRYYKGRAMHSTLPRSAAIIRQRNESVAEEMRVLYVAMTRAKQRLILVSASKKAAKYLESAGKPLSPSEIRKAACPLVWLMSAAAEGDPVLPLYPVSRSSLLRDTEAISDQIREAFSEEDKRMLAQTLSYRYPYPDATALPSKQSVSSVSHAFPLENPVPVADTFSFNPPAFQCGSTPGAAARGSVTHRLLELLPLQKLDSRSFRTFSDSLLASGHLTSEEADLVDSDAVIWFSNTEIWQRAAASSALHREWVFTERVPACKVYNTTAEDPVLLQGVMDCCFLEPEGWVLLDYKTDRLRSDETPESHAEIHRRQLELYADALESLSGKPVKEKAVILLNAHAVVSLM